MDFSSIGFVHKTKQTLREQHDLPQGGRNSIWPKSYCLITRQMELVALKGSEGLLERWMPGLPLHQPSTLLRGKQVRCGAS